MSLLASIGIWIKSNIVISIIVGTVVVGGVIATPIIIDNLRGNNKEFKVAENEKKLTCINSDDTEESELIAIFNSNDNLKILDITMKQTFDDYIEGAESGFQKSCNDVEKLTKNVKCSVIKIGNKIEVKQTTYFSKIKDKKTKEKLFPYPNDTYNDFKSRFIKLGYNCS